MNLGSSSLAYSDESSNSDTDDKPLVKAAESTELNETSSDLFGIASSLVSILTTTTTPTSKNTPNTNPSFYQSIPTNTMTTEALSVRIGDIAANQFVNHYFDVPISFVAERSDVKLDSIPLTIQMKYEGGGVPDPSLNLLTIDPRTPPIIKGGGYVVVRVMINLLSVQCENKRFVLHVSASVPGARYVAPGVSGPVKCIRHMLKITNKLPDLWFKDEGGRDKCMEITVQLINSSGHLVTDRKVPLKLVLKYENGNEVLQQELFKISPECRRYIDDSGSATIKFRVEDVSKNHQKQSFGITVSPDTTASPQSADIGSVMSSYVDIKSKRNKRKSGGEDDYGSDTVNKTARYSADPVPSALANMTFGAPLAARPSATSANPAQTVYVWINQTLGLLESISWRLIGFERKVDGSEDKAKPLYSMTNPNAAIEQARGQFASMQIHECMLALARAFDAAPTGINSSSNSNGVSANGNSNSFAIPKPSQLERQSTAAMLEELASLPMLPSRAPSLAHTSSTLNWPTAWRQQSVDTFCTSLDSFLGANGPADYSTASDNLQREVFSILATEYTSIKSKKILGMPAFDARSVLVGFYKYDQTSGSSLYYTADEVDADLATDDKDHLYGLISGGNSLLCTIEKTGDPIKDLDRLRERAFFKIWENS